MPVLLLRIRVDFFQYGCLHCTGALFPEDTFIKESLYWRIAACFFSESWPTRGMEEIVHTAYGEIVFLAINITISKQSFEASTEVFTNDNSNKWASRPAWGHHVNDSFLSCHHAPCFFISSQGLSLNIHITSSMVMTGAIWRLQGRFCVTQLRYNSVECMVCMWNSLEIRSGTASFKMCRLLLEYHSQRLNNVKCLISQQLISYTVLFLFLFHRKLLEIFNFITWCGIFHISVAMEPLQYFSYFTMPTNHLEI